MNRASPQFFQKEFSMHTVSLTHQLVAIQDDFDLDKIIERPVLPAAKVVRRALPLSFRQRTLSDSAGRWSIRRRMVWLRLGRWADYFDLGRNYAALRCSPAGQSNYLDKSLDFGQGIRILHQDPWEMLSSPFSSLPAQEHSGHPHRRGTPCLVLRRTAQCRRR